MTRIAATEAGGVAPLLRAGSCCPPLASGPDQHAITPPLPPKAASSNGRWIRKPTAQTRGLNRNRQPLLKAIFKGAATTVIHQMPHHPLHQDFQRMISEAAIKPNLAKLTLARRIAAATLAVWKHQEDYDPSKQRRAPLSQ